MRCGCLPFIITDGEFCIEYMPHTVFYVKVSDSLRPFFQTLTFKTNLLTELGQSDLKGHDTLILHVLPFVVSD